MKVRRGLSRMTSVNSNSAQPPSTIHLQVGLSRDADYRYRAGEESKSPHEKSKKNLPVKSPIEYESEPENELNLEEDEELASTTSRHSIINLGAFY